jgi:hypothetical protein
MNRGKQSKGIALISVLFIAAVVLILASTFIFTIVRERQSATSSKLMNDSLQVADALSERARMQILQEFDSSSYTPANFLLELKEGSNSDLNAMLAASADITIEGRKGKWRISDYTGNGVSLADATKSLNNPQTLKWIEVSATVTTATGTQTVIRRINMGEGELFRLAMLARNTNCIYCHLRVNGDVGSLGDLRPGWGKELDGVAPPHGWEDGWNSGNGSEVDGNVFIATEASEDANENMTDAAKSDSSLDKKINGTVFTGVVEEGYKQSPLPRDTSNPPDGIPDFPFIERERARKNARGSISSNKYMAVVPLDSSSISVLPTAITAPLNGVIDGNLILEGTLANPIKLDGDIYVTGDVIIKGYVEGRGAIYSGRNTYVAGNIQYKNPPPNCATESNPDSCARTAIAAGKDELRLAARNNIVLGDYTETTNGVTKKTWQGLQSADYYRSQFGFDSTTETKYFDKTNGDQLTFNGTAYKDVEGNIVPSSKVQAKNAKDAYNYSFQPGMVKSDGGFNNWLPDNLYQGILGTETRKYDTWRYTVPDRATMTLADLQKQFSSYGVTDDILTSMLCPTTCSNKNVDLKNATGNVIGQAVWSGKDSADPDDFDLRVIIDPAFTYEKQVTKVDAFLYANQRIAGKTFNAPLSINGGMIGQEIGVLAPGIEKQWWMDSRYTDILNGKDISGGLENRCQDEDFVKQFTTESDPTKSPAFNTYAIDCALTINYDFRLRNGGLGFNLVTPDAGQTMSWKLADSKAERVE